jgi:hypothetical protein
VETLERHSEAKTSPGLLGFLAGFIWFMNSKWSWREVLTMLDGLLSVLCEGAQRRHMTQVVSSETTQGFLPNYS